MNRVKNKISAAFIGYVLLGVGVGVGGAAISGSLNHTSTSADSACVIQNRGLKAQGYLVAAMKNMRKLLTPQEKPGKIAEQQRKEASPELLRTVDNMNENLDKWITIQEAQPKGRKC